MGPPARRGAVRGRGRAGPQARASPGSAPHSAGRRSRRWPRSVDGPRRTFPRASRGRLIATSFAAPASTAPRPTSWPLVRHRPRASAGSASWARSSSADRAASSREACFSRSAASIPTSGCARRPLGGQDESSVPRRSCSSCWPSRYRPACRSTRRSTARRARRAASWPRSWSVRAVSMTLGRPRGEEFRDLSERTGAPTLAALGLALRLSDRLGVPLADSLRDQARRSRAEAARTVQERAARAGPRVLAVVVFVLVPAALLPIATAVALTVAGALGGQP